MKVTVMHVVGAGTIKITSRITLIIEAFLNIIIELELMTSGQDHGIYQIVKSAHVFLFFYL